MYLSVLLVFYKKNNFSQCDWRHAGMADGDGDCVTGDGMGMGMWLGGDG